MRSRLPYGIEPAPRDLQGRSILYAALRWIAYVSIVVSIWIGVAMWLGDGPPPSERTSDTFYGLSEGE